MSDRPNVVVLAIDTLRADHLGCYGYRRQTSPNINALAAEGALIEQFICSVLPTFPSFTTFYTGQRPLTHGILGHGGRNVLAREAPHLVPQFLAAEYVTCAVDNLMRERLWFGRGYEFYIDPGMRRTLSLTVTCEELNARAIPWLRQHHEEPFFLFVHYWDPHTPYTPPARYQNLFYEGTNPTDPQNRALDRMWEHPNGMIARDSWLRSPQGLITDPEYARALYDREIRYVDDGIGQIVSAIDELGLTDNTLIVLFGDHGESMTEHGIYFDHFGLYDTTIHVPFIARWPGRIPAGLRLPQLLQHHDIAPTLLDAAGVEIPEEMEGQSFWPLLSGETTVGGRDKVLTVEATWQAWWSLRTNQHKLILSRESEAETGVPRVQLFDLQCDPNEEQNLATVQPDLAATLECDLEGMITEHLAALGIDEDPLISEGAVLKLAWRRPKEG